MATALLVLAVLAVVCFTVLGYRKLQHLQRTIDNRWKEVIRQISRRHDLIPTLVDSIKPYASSQVPFDDMSRARSAAISATSLSERVQAEERLHNALRNLFAVADNCSDLQYSQPFSSSVVSLSRVEDELLTSCELFNAAVSQFNSAVQSFPTNVVAACFRVKSRQPLQISEPARRPVSTVWA